MALAALASSCNGWVHQRVAPQPDAGPLTLLLTDPAGAPLAGVPLEVAGKSLTTDAAGRASAALPEGGYLASVVTPPPGLMADWRPVQVVAGRDEVVRWSLPRADDSDVRLLFAGDVSF